jgi:hypothetical protein
VAQERQHLVAGGPWSDGAGIGDGAAPQW